MFFIGLVLERKTGLLKMSVLSWKAESFSDGWHIKPVLVSIGHWFFSLGHFSDTRQRRHKAVVFLKLILKFKEYI